MKNRDQSAVEGKKYNRGIEITSLITVLILSIIGIGITEFRPLVSYRYWGTMTLILAISGIIIGWSKQMREGKPVKKMILTQAVHWAATLAAVGGILLLLLSGRLNTENTGLVILITLGLSTFLDGYRVNWSFSAIGVMMFITALIGAYVEQYVWILLIVIICTSVIIIILEKYAPQSRKVKSDTKPQVSNQQEETTVEHT